MTAQTRREFIRTFGAALGAALAAGLLPGCRPAVVTCYAAATVTPGPSVTPTPHPAWTALRRIWFDVARSQTSPEIEAYRARHRDLLGELVAAGALDAPIAAEMQRAFDEATTFYNGAGVPLPTCYAPMPPPRPTDIGCYVPPTPTACYQSPRLVAIQWTLAEQVKALAEMSAKAGLDPATVAQAQDALEQDIALFELVAACDALPPGEHLAEEDRLVARFDSGSVDVPPESLAAARILVALLVRGETP